MPLRLLTGVLLFALCSLGFSLAQELYKAQALTLLSLFHAIGFISIAYCLAKLRRTSSLGACCNSSREEHVLAETIEKLPCAIATLTENFEIRSLNKEVQRLTGHRKTDCLGKKCYDIFGKGDICPHCPVQRAIVSKTLQQTIKKEYTKTGSLLCLEQTAIPILKPDGSISHILEVAIDVTKKMQLELENRDLFIQTVSSLAQLIDNRDTSTGAHSLNVQKISLKIAKALRLPPQVLEEVSVAALLHDIGKIGIPEAVLNKPGKLTMEEFSIIKQHPEIGYKTLRNINPLKNIAEYIRYHHEKYDGTGYPFGKKGEEIPLISRILIVADVFEALTADRVYRTAMPPHEVIATLRAGRGSHFDPQILDTFFVLLRQDPAYSSIFATILTA